jgi:heavy metal translocating P-type ATPase
MSITLPVSSLSDKQQQSWQFSSCCIDLDQTDLDDEAWKILTRLAWGILFSMDTMMMSFFLYYDWARALIFGGGSTIPAGIVLLFKILMLVGSTLTMFVLVPPILFSSWQGLREKRISTDTLIAIGSLSGYFASLYSFAQGGDVYFDTATTILVFVTAGHYLELNARARGSESLERLLTRAPDVACVIRNGEETEVPASTIKLNETVIVRPGSSIPVDAVVAGGSGSVNEASITGEADLVYKEPGDVVYSGTVNVDGQLTLRATGVGEDRVMAKLVRLLREALSRRAPVQRLADQVSSIFVPLTVLSALSAFVVWSLYLDPSRGLLVALAVLLIACPCALGVATPLAIWAGMGRAAEGGVLIRSAEALEKLANVKAVFFDKTGTLTKGTLKLNDIIAADGIPEEKVVSLAASLESASEHSLGRAVIVYALKNKIAIRPVTNFKAYAGLGIEGIIQTSEFSRTTPQQSGVDKNSEVLGIVGSSRFMDRLNILNPLRDQKEKLESLGRTVVCVAWEGEVRGLLGFSEAVRPESSGVIRELIEDGIAVEALTGDDRSAAEALANQLNIPVHANLLPEDKQILIVGARNKFGNVAMVGDGLNDAPALARADVGIALGCGVDVTRETADVSFIGSDLRHVAWTIHLARETYQTIRQNLWWAFFYNVIGIALAMVGVLHPIVSAIAMVVSNLFVVGNSLRLARSKEKHETLVEEFAGAS